MRRRRIEVAKLQGRRLRCGLVEDQTGTGQRCRICGSLQLVARGLATRNVDGQRPHAEHDPKR